MATRGSGNRNAAAEAPVKKPKPQPEKKIGPLPNGIAACIWLNTVDTNRGPRQVRSITINPRRYYDEKSDTWKDANSYNTADLPSLIFCLQKVQEYIYETPLRRQTEYDSPENGQPSDEDPAY